MVGFGEVVMWREIGLKVAGAIEVTIPRIGVSTGGSEVAVRSLIVVSSVTNGSVEGLGGHSGGNGAMDVSKGRDSDCVGGG